MGIATISRSACLNAAAAIAVTTMAQMATVYAAAENSDRPVQETSNEFNRSKQVAARGNYFVRNFPAWARTGPGHHFAAPYRLAGNRGYEARGKFVDDQKEIWYELDLGEGRTGYVAASGLLSQANHQRKTVLTDFDVELIDWVDKTRKASRGPHASFTGFYSETKTCLAGPSKTAADFLEDRFFLWFDGDIMLKRLMDGTSAVIAHRLQPTRRVNLKQDGEIQWYAWGGEQVAFNKGRFLREPEFFKPGVKYKWATHCTTDDLSDFDQIMFIDDALTTIIEKLPTD